MKKFIRGEYVKSIFETENGYTVGILKLKETNDEELQKDVQHELTFTGYFADLKKDDQYILYGEMIEHPKYGEQYQVEEYEHVMPEDKDGVIAFLSSDLFPKIGVKQATQIVETLGSNAISKIMEEPSCLSLVPKLTAKKATQIVNRLKEYEDSHQTIVYLTELGFAMKDALLIYNTYKKRTTEIMERNPYQLIEELEEITFLKIDKLHQRLSIAEDNEERLQACILYEIKELLYTTGNTYVEFPELFPNVCKYLCLALEEAYIQEELHTLVLEDKVVLEQEKIYLKKFYDAETYIAQKVYMLQKITTSKIKNLNTYLQALEERDQMIYNEKQKQAIQKALENNLLIITGGPGTGKTTIMKAIVEIYATVHEKEGDQLMKDIALLAPTGRASKKMSEATKLPASTIHRFLKWDKDTNTFMVDETNKATSKLVIVDEASMIDLELMSNLLKGLLDTVQLIFVGDFHQLPSVGPGNVLKDMIESDVIDTVHLDLLYRQSQESYIPVLADQIKNNHIEEDFLNQRDDYRFLSCSKEMIAGSVEQICKQLKEKSYDEKRVQFMAPMYAGMSGIDHLNQILQNILNPPSDDKVEILYGNVIFRENDKVLQLVNMPDENVFNGDIGFIQKIMMNPVSKKHEIFVNFDNNVVKYTQNNFSKIKHGYAISIHKSQGSEFEMVVIPVSMSYYRMLYRKLIYTGITRAKQKLILLGEPKAFLYAVSNDHEIIRKTALKERLINLYS